MPTAFGCCTRQTGHDYGFLLLCHAQTHTMIPPFDLSTDARLTLRLVPTDAKPPREVSKMSKPKVLIANDEQASLLVLRTVLETAPDSATFEIVTASSGHETLHLVLLHQFAVILLDVNMPGMDGFETAELLRKSRRSAEIPIIFITAYSPDDISRLLKGYELGAVDFLFTPVVPQILQTKVSVFVQLVQKNIELQGKTQELAELNQDLRVQRLQDLKKSNAALQLEIIERRQAESRASELATRDALTGLYNRRSLVERIDDAIVRAARRKEYLGVLFLDLDKFKPINDTYGHDVGDELLRQMAQRIKAAVRDSDVVARIGGDEFIVLLEGLANDDDAAKLAEKIVSSTSQLCQIGSHNITASVSIGISMYPQDATTSEELLKEADLAMYSAKHDSRGSFRFFHKNGIAAAPLGRLN